MRIPGAGHTLTTQPGKDMVSGMLAVGSGDAGGGGRVNQIASGTKTSDG
jgi:hypothetical protein